MMNCCYYWLFGRKEEEEKQGDDLKKDLLTNEVQSEYIQRSGSDESNSVGTQTPIYLSDVQSDSEMQSENSEVQSDSERQSDNDKREESGMQSDSEMQEESDEASETSTLVDPNEDYMFERISSDEAQERGACSVNSSAETVIRFVVSN